MREDNLSNYEYKSLIEWMKDPNRKPANTAFTASVVRDCGRCFEEYLEGASKPGLVELNEDQLNKLISDYLVADSDLTEDIAREICEKFGTRPVKIEWPKEQDQSATNDPIKKAMREAYNMAIRHCKEYFAKAVGGEK